MIKGLHEGLAGKRFAGSSYSKWHYHHIPKLEWFNINTNDFSLDVSPKPSLTSILKRIQFMIRIICSKLDVEFCPIHKNYRA